MLDAIEEAAVGLSREADEAFAVGSDFGAASKFGVEMLAEDFFAQPPAWTAIFVLTFHVAGKTIAPLFEEERYAADVALLSNTAHPVRVHRTCARAALPASDDPVW